MPRATVLCVHGNPSWSYLWRHVLATAPAEVRVVAVDHLDMGYSERTGTTRRLAQRIDDLWDLTAALEMTGPVVTVAHDWGGPISLGWAQRWHVAEAGSLAGVVLMNTAVHQPADALAPRIIRLVRTRGLLGAVTKKTDAFVRGASQITSRGIDADVRAAFRAPYATAARRAAVQEFVADIPLEPTHPTAGPLDAVAAGLAAFGDVPSLLIWGAKDLVFSDVYLDDLQARLPHADVVRHADAGHFVSEEVDAVTPLWSWFGGLGVGGAAAPISDTRVAAPSGEEALDAVLSDALIADRPAIVELGERSRSTSFAEFDQLVNENVTAFKAMGIRRGDRVALMITPGLELAACVYACWRMGAVLVLVDGGLPPQAIGKAVRAAKPAHIIGIPRAIAAAVAMRWPGVRWSVDPQAGPLRLAAKDSLVALRAKVRMPSESAASVAEADDEAAIVFTSGSTGPSKGVVYRHGQVQAQVAALRDCYDISPDDRLVAAFAPFMLYGPALGIASAVPDMDVTSPGTLTWSALHQSIEKVDATMVFASPAALQSACAGAPATPTAAAQAVRLVLSAGAPVSMAILERAQECFPNAAIATPYGMTEMLPVSSVTLDERRAAGTEGDGVCVGVPLDGVEVQIEKLSALGEPTGELVAPGSGWGEIIVRGSHMRDRYLQLAPNMAQAGRWPGWHATGDVGSVDSAGRLWVAGRTAHVISTADGLVAPVGLEQALGALDGVKAAAIVGVGPPGTQVIVAVLETDPPSAGPEVPLDLIDRCRSAATEPLAAVLAIDELPTDRRHNAKVDRAALAKWADGVLSG